MKRNILNADLWVVLNGSGKNNRRRGKSVYFRTCTLCFLLCGGTKIKLKLNTVSAASPKLSSELEPSCRPNGRLSSQAASVSYLKFSRNARTSGLQAGTQPGRPSDQTNERLDGRTSLRWAGQLKHPTRSFTGMAAYFGRTSKYYLLAFGTGSGYAKSVT